MAVVSFEGEFMKQFVPAAPISNTHAFHAVHDEQSRPIIFSIGSEGNLFALLPHGTNSQALPLDLHPLFGLGASAVVSALSVLQDKQLNIYLIFAVNGLKPEDPSFLYVVHPTKPTEWLAASKDPKSAPLLLKNTSTEKRLIKSLYLAGFSKSQYPTPVVIYSEASGTGVNAAYLDIDVPNNQWKYSHSFELPETPEKMIDIRAGTLTAGINGLFCLYDDQGIKLTFAGFQSVPYPQLYATSLRVPPGAKSLATFVNPQGFTDLLVGGDAVTHYPAIIALHSDQPGGPDRFTYVTKDSDPYLDHVSQITVAQSATHDSLSIYGRNADDTVVYQQCTVTPGPAPAKLTLSGSSIPLLRRSQGGGHFTVLLDAATGSQKLFIVGEGDTLTRMEQSGGTQLWQRIPVLVPSAAKNKEITTYTSHIHVSDSNGVSIANTKFLLCSSSEADLGSNGSAILTTPDGVPVTTDDDGDITLIQTVTGVSSVVFTLKDCPQAHILNSPRVLNPAAKVQDVLDKIKTPDDARNARLPNGKKILDYATGKPGDVDKVAKVLPSLSSALRKLPSDGSESRETGPEDSDASDWGIFHWISEAIHDVEDFVVKGWHLLVTFAGKAFKFLLKTAAHVLQGVHWLLQDVLHIPVDKIIAWLGFEFGWHDILETHDILAAMVNFGIDYAVAKIDDFATVVDGWFKHAEDMIEKLDSVPADLLDRTMSRDTVNSQFKAQKRSAALTKTPGSNWSNYQLKHGGVAASLREQNPDHPKSFSPLHQFWDDVAKPALKSIETAILDAFKNITAMFHSGGELSFGQLLKHFGVQLLHDILDVLRKVVVGLIRFIADFASDVKVLINKSIDIPFISPLYRLITDGHDLTMLDAIALLVAVPMTVVYKATTGHKPGDIGGVQEFLKKYKDHHSRMDPRPSNSVQMLVEKHDTVAESVGLSPFLKELFTLAMRFVPRLGGLVMPFLNLVFLVMSPADWYDPDDDPPAVGWYAKMVFGILACVVTFPYNDIPGHLDLYRCRLISWALHVPSIPAIPFNVHFRGVVALATACFQLVPEIFSIPEAIRSAKDGSYPGKLGPELVWADFGDRIFSLVGSGAGGVCMIMTEPEPISFSVAFATSAVSILCEAVKAGDYVDNIKAAIETSGMPQAALSRVL